MFFRNIYALVLIVLYIFAYAGMGVHSCTFDDTVEFTLVSEELSYDDAPHFHHGHEHHHVHNAECHHTEECCNGHVHTVFHHCDEHCGSGVHFYQTDCCSIGFYVLTDSQDSSDNFSKHKIFYAVSPVAFLLPHETVAVGNEIQVASGSLWHNDINHHKMFSVWKL